MWHTPAFFFSFFLLFFGVKPPLTHSFLKTHATPALFIHYFCWPEQVMYLEAHENTFPFSPICLYPGVCGRCSTFSIHPVIAFSVVSEVMVVHPTTTTCNMCLNHTRSVCFCQHLPVVTHFPEHKVVLWSVCFHRQFLSDDLHQYGP